MGDDPGAEISRKDVQIIVKVAQTKERKDGVDEDVEEFGIYESGLF